MGCTQQKVDKVESLRDAYFQIAEKIVNKEEISSKYIKKLLNGYNYKKDEEFKIEGQNIDGSDYIQQPYTFTNGNESLNITYSNFNNEEQIHPLYNLKDEKGETNLSILLPEIDDTKMRYMYIANRDNLKDHKKLLEKLDNNEGKWRDVYYAGGEPADRSNGCLYCRPACTESSGRRGSGDYRLSGRCELRGN